ncbi:MAG: rhodanese-like domain-containing protein [Bacteroidales bacterium]
MKNTKLLWYFITFSILFFAACSDDDDETPAPTPVNESQVLASYLESTSSPYGKYYVNTDMPSIIKAEAVHNDIVAGTAMTMIDIRSDVDFANGHIDGAVNVAAGAVLDYIETEGLAMDAKIIVICYTGQTAGWVTSILRLNGYTNAFDMKWGMSSWHSDFAAKWSTNVSNMYSTQFEGDAVAKGAVGSMPTLSTGKTTGQEIFSARVTDILTEGFGAAKISSAEVFANTGNYYIVNYWAESDYTLYGHIPGAMQYTPKMSISTTADLKTLPTDKTIVVYCWTGQTSAFLTTYLRLLGYDAKSLLFGANGMIYDELDASHQWSDVEVMDYDYVN